MPRVRRLAFILASALLWLGCDPGMRVNAVVTGNDEAPGRGGATSPSVAIAGAVVWLRCPDGERLLGETGPDGRFSYFSLGTMLEDCRLRIVRDGYLPVEYRVGDVCATKLVLAHCPLVELEPVLRRLDPARR